MSRKYWEEWTSLCLGIWLFLSPWALRLIHEGAGTLNFFVMGAAVAVLAGMALYMHLHALWEDWVTLVLGMWMIVSPHVLGFAHDFAATINAAIVGLLLMGLALFAMHRDIHGDDKGAWTY